MKTSTKRDVIYYKADRGYTEIFYVLWVVLTASIFKNISLIQIEVHK